MVKISLLTMVGLMNNTVLVTGADGFIGSHLVEKLVSSGINVRAFFVCTILAGSWGWLDTLPTELKDNLDVVLGDIRDPLCVKNSMTGCSQVFHLAALIGIPYSYVAPSSYRYKYSWHIKCCSICKDLGIERVIHTSTSEAYGSAQFVPITEVSTCWSILYAATKIAADQIALSYWRSFETPVTVLRLFNTYGPRQSSRAVIPTIISQIESGKQKIRTW